MHVYVPAARPTQPAEKMERDLEHASFLQAKQRYDEVQCGGQYYGQEAGEVE